MESQIRQLGLIETLRWDGAAFVRLDLHLARLERSARQFGWSADGARAALEAALPEGPARMRLLLTVAGIEVTAAPLTPVRGPWRVVVAPTRLRSDDPWLRVKSTRRELYDTARAALDGADEAIFLNERGEVCEGTITNIFFDRGQGMRTPPLSSGLLPGVLRAELLQNGAREEVLMPDDLGQVRLWVGNSLRGLIEVAPMP